MCASTRFPEAVPLRKITSGPVVKALTKFFSTFRLPKIVQTDQGTNFQSKLFKQALQSMLCKYFLNTSKHRDEGVPFALYAACESVQESLGFSPAELVFGH